MHQFAPIWKKPARPAATVTPGSLDVDTVKRFRRLTIALPTTIMSALLCLSSG